MKRNHRTVVEVIKPLGSYLNSDDDWCYVIYPENSIRDVLRFLLLEGETKESLKNLVDLLDDE